MSARNKPKPNAAVPGMDELIDRMTVQAIKMNQIYKEEQCPPAVDPNYGKDASDSDLRGALKNLGFKRALVNHVVPRTPNGTIDERIKDALNIIKKERL